MQKAVSCIRIFIFSPIINKYKVNSVVGGDVQGRGACGEPRAGQCHPAAHSVRPRGHTDRVRASRRTTVKVRLAATQRLVYDVAYLPKRENVQHAFAVAWTFADHADDWCVTAHRPLRICVYDARAGGTGISQHVLDILPQLLRQALAIIEVRGCSHP
jgi:hypothetical protein